MKKLIIVSTIMVMVLTMAMPCFANTYGGEFVLNDNIANLPEGEYPLPFTMNGERFVALRINHNIGDFGSFVREDGETLVVYATVSGGWKEEEYKYIVFEPFNADPSSPLFAMVQTIGTFQPHPFNVSVLDELKDKFQNQIGVSNIVQLLAVLATAVVGIVFMWWGVRKLSRAVFSAFRKGKISV